MKAILHIGIEKTGSTSIQSALAEDRKALAARGILYPTLFGSANHMELAVAAMDDTAENELTILELGRQGCGHAEYRQRLASRLQQELAEGAYHTLILSNEHCHSRLLTPDTLARLAWLLRDIVDADEIRVLVYLRRQDRLAASLHSTRLKLGGQGEMFPFSKGGDLPDYFRFDRLLDRYAACFGSENLIVRLFEPSRLKGSDAVSDFYHTAELGPPPAATAKSNTALSAAQSLFLTRFNEEFPMLRDGKINPERGPIAWAIRDTCPGFPFRPARGEAQRFYELFRESNAPVREHYLPELDRPTLFDESFDEYPVEGDPTELTSEQMFAFQAATWRFWQRQRGS